MLRRTNRRGFTLIEILLVVMIIAMIAGLVAPQLAGKGRDAQIKKAIADIEGGLAMALELYELDNGVFPQNLEDLINDPGSARRWKGPYLKKRVIPKDPWGNEYVYSFPGSQNTSSYDLSSAGPDGQPSTEDDISNWQEHEN
ncbi:MAG: type II secretion system major pseudopilin GspG [Candidatus Omnitrophica bacterium]|nr:type II secretion system major pseudopilin GspG [Candidatus Omnitrophota bacterium]